MSQGRRKPWALDLEGISAGHEGRAVVQGFSARLSPGDLVAVVGPNGTGKSTLLQVLAGDLAPLAGQLRWHSSPRRPVAWLPQQNPIERDFPISVEGFVGTGLWPRQGLLRRFGPGDRQRLDQVLDQLGLTPLARRPIGKLSGGQFQRMRFARLLLQDACLLLLDEPFTGVDEATVATLMCLLQQQQARGTAVVAVVHDAALVRRYFATTWRLTGHRAHAGPTPPQSVLYAVAPAVAANHRTLAQ